MAEITLSDYTGFIFRELILAREMADAYSRQVAETYAKDAVMRHFSVPRFKVPKLDLTIPVLISGARYAETVRFAMPLDRFTDAVLARVNDAVAAIRRSRRAPFQPVRDPPILRDVVIGRPGRVVEPIGGDEAEGGSEVEEKIREQTRVFHETLVANPDPTRPAAIVDKMWHAIFEMMLSGYDLLELYKASNPNNELFSASRDEVLKLVLTNTVVDSTQIQSLLVNPETNVVKNGSDAASVFVIRAEMIEEGFFIRSVKDGETGEIRPVVEFE